MSTVPPMLRALVDDAAVFPPGNASLADAVPAHREYGETWLADLVGPLVLPASPAAVAQAASLAEGGADPMAVILVGTAAEVVAAVPAVEAAHSLALASVELRLAASTAGATAADVKTAVATTRAATDVPVAVELPLAGAGLGPGWQGAVDAAATAGVRVKLRTGGETPAAYPTPSELATALRTLVAREVSFKCTAGLHHAIRAEDGSGQVQHGFVNVLLATRACLDGADLRTVTTILEELSGDRLVADVHELGAMPMREARRWFTSFGSCSVDDPVADLRALGLL